MDTISADSVKQAVTVASTSSNEYTLGMVFGAIGVALTFLVQKGPAIWALLRNKPVKKVLVRSEVEAIVKSNSIGREDVETMIKNHDEAATVKTTLLLREHEKSCMQCMDARFREQAKIEAEWRERDYKERTEFRKEMREGNQRIHDRIDVLAGR